jgi:hypothetical protein
MKFAPLQIVKGANVFFWTLEKDLLQATLTFLEKEMTAEIKTHLVKELNLQNNGGGMEAYMYSLKETLQNSMTSPSWDLESASLFSRLQSKAMSYSNENLNA